MFDDFETGHLERKRGDEYCLGRIVDELDSMPQAQRAATTDPGGAAPSMSTIASPLFNANFDEHATVDELRHSYESAISMVTDALGSHASGWTSSEVRIDRGQGLTHLFHGPQADVRVEIYHQLYGPSSSDQLPTVPRSPSRRPPITQARAQAQARLKETVCVSDDLALEWRNPTSNPLDCGGFRELSLLESGYLL